MGGDGIRRNTPGFNKFFQNYPHQRFQHSPNSFSSSLLFCKPLSLFLSLSFSLQPRIQEAEFPAPKSSLILKLSLLLSIPYFFLVLFRYNFEPELRRSILINAGLSLAAFFVTFKMTPVAVPYLLRKNICGYDLNKMGTPQGNIKVPEALGLAVGIVFIVFSILFLYFNFPPDSNVSIFSICWRYLNVLRWDDYGCGRDPWPF